MSSKNINELLGANLDQEIDEILGDDDLDMLLGSPNVEQDMGAYSDAEKVLLDNKSFLEKTSNHKLDAHFLDLQEKLYSELENTLEDFSLGAVSDDDEFGEDPDDQELDELEFALEAMEFGGDDDEFGVLGLGLAAIGKSGKRATRALMRENKRKERQIRRALKANRRQMNREGRRAKRGVRIGQRKARVQLRRTNSRLTQERYIRLRRKYLKIISRFKRTCGRFERIGKKAPPKQIAALAAAPFMLTQNPFTTMAMVASSRFGELTTHLSGDHMGDDEFGLGLGIAGAVQGIKDIVALPGKRISARRRRRGTRRNSGRMVRINRAANKCDKKYARLVKIWRRLGSLGNRKGLPSPQSVVGRSAGWIKKMSKKRPARLTPMESAALQKARLRARRKNQLLRQRQMAARQANIVANRKRALLRKTAISNARVSAKQEFDGLDPSAYVFQEDLKSLERAAVERAKDQYRRPIPSPVVRRPVPSPVRRPVLRRQPSALLREVGQNRQAMSQKMMLRRAASRRRKEAEQARRSEAYRRRKAQEQATAAKRRAILQRATPSPSGMTISRPVPQKRITRASPGLKKSRSSNLASKFRSEMKKIVSDIKIAEMRLKASVANHRKAMAAKKQAEARKDKVMANRHYQAIKKHAQVSSNIRSQIKTNNLKLTQMKSRAAAQGIRR